MTGWASPPSIVVLRYPLGLDRNSGFANSKPPSYTDNGRLAYIASNNGSNPAPGVLPPTINVTASGGLAWPQFVAQDSGARLIDYAVSGATCSNKIIARYLDAIRRPFPSVREDQISSFKADVGFKSMYPNRTAENTVYALWIGTNDLSQDAFLTDSQAPGTTITDYVNCIWEVFDNIYTTGGRRFVLLNLAPLELSPDFASLDAGGAGDSRFWPNKTLYNTTEYSYKMKEYTTNVNTMFDYGAPFHLLVKKRWPGAEFSIFDVHALIKNIFYHPKEYLDAPYNATGYYHRCSAQNQSDCVNQSEYGPLSSFLWYDELHPSEKTGKRLRKGPKEKEKKRALENVDGTFY